MGNLIDVAHTIAIEQYQKSSSNATLSMIANEDFHKPSSNVAFVIFTEKSSNVPK